MDKWKTNSVILSILLISSIASFPTYAQQSCSTYSFRRNGPFATCLNLPVLNSFLHWTHHPANNTVDIAYRHTNVTASNWVAWALNPSASGMRQAQSLVAFQNTSGVFRAYTSPIPNGYGIQLAEAPLSFRVPSLTAEFNGNEMIIFATIELPPGKTSFQQVWQVGSLSGGTPLAHTTTPDSDNLRSVGTVDFAPVQPPTPSEGGGSNSGNNCSSFSFRSNGPFRTCITLPVLNSFLHWTHNPANNTVDIAYRHGGVTASNWVAWALNPSASGMRQAQSLVAFQNTSGLVRAYTSPIPNGYGTQLAEAPLSFRVPSLTAEFNGNEMIIFATVELPPGQTSFQQVWQVGSLSGDTPLAHTTTTGSDNMRSVATVDFATGQVAAGGGSNSILRRRNVHGVLNVVSWGVLMPLGVVLARYLKVFNWANPAWFYLHVACQTSAYIVGVAGWGTGLKLGSDSTGLTYDTHRNIGIALFSLATLQVFALLLRPKPDHKYRFYWNLYHWGIGYTVVVLSIVNIFKGFDILDPEKKWKNAYIGILIAIGAMAAVLEAFTWLIVLKRKKDGTQSNRKYPHSSNGVNGANGANGYSERGQQLGA